MNVVTRSLIAGAALTGVALCVVGLAVGQPALQPPGAPALQPPAPAAPAQLPQIINQSVPAINPQNLHPTDPRTVQPAVQVISSTNGTVTENGSPTARQEPAVSLEWVGPATAKVGQPVSYQLVVKNISVSPVTQVVVKAVIPDGASVSATEPKAATENNHLVWDIGSLEPRQEKRMDLQMVPETTGVVPCQAYVTLTGSSLTRLRVFEPKLSVKATVPEKVIVNDPATVTITVTNPGDATAEGVKVKAQLSDGLEHARGTVIEFDLGNLAPKEVRTAYVLCGAKTAGPQKCEAVAFGEPKLHAIDTANVEVLVPKVELSVTGPGMRYLDRHAIYTLKVTNPGTATANHVSLLHEMPQGFTFANASHDGRHDFVARTVSWHLGDIPAGQSQEVTLDLVAVNTGEHKHKACVNAARGLKADNSVITRVEGLPALLMELVDLDDPVEVGADTSYEIRVTNTGTKTETNLQLTCTVPDKMEFRGAKGPAGVSFKQEGNEIVFDAIPKLAPRADVIYRISVRGLSAGDLRFRSRIKADGLSDPVLKEESTKVYGDER
jgi:uncharacterized repeat protein (TIGR01451 family)